MIHSQRNINTMPRRSWGSALRQMWLGVLFQDAIRSFGRTHDSWEPASALLPHYTQCFVDFLNHSKIDLKVTDVCVPKKA